MHIFELLKFLAEMFILFVIALSYITLLSKTRKLFERLDPPKELKDKNIENERKELEN